MDSSQSQSHNGINAKREVVVVVGGGQYATVWNVRDPQMHDTTPQKKPKNKKLLQNKLNSNFVKIKIK